jgi:hypothetical protein
MSGLSDGTRVVITGHPTPEEIAAVIVALDAAAEQDSQSPPRRSGWQQAARHEAVGGRLVRSRNDLTP